MPSGASHGEHYSAAAMKAPEAAVLEIQLTTAHRVLRKIFDEVLDSQQREALAVVLLGDTRDVFRNLRHQPSPDIERSLVAHSIEELVLIRGMLTVESNPSSGQAVD